MTQLNGALERIFAVIEEGALEIRHNAKLKKTAHKMLWAKVVHTCKHVRNSIETMNSTKSLFEILYLKKPISLVCSQSLDIFCKSLRGRILRGR